MIPQWVIYIFPHFSSNNQVAVEEIRIFMGRWNCFYLIFKVRQVHFLFILNNKSKNPYVVILHHLGSKCCVFKTSDSLYSFNKLLSFFQDNSTFLTLLLILYQNIYLLNLYFYTPIIISNSLKILYMFRLILQQDHPFFN